MAEIPWIQIFLAFLAAPFIYTLASLLIYDDADERGDSLAGALAAAALARGRAGDRESVPSAATAFTARIFFRSIILAAIGGTLMSQQLWGSTYAIWPLLALLIAELLAVLAWICGA